MNLEKLIKVKLNELKKEYNKLLKENKQDKYKVQIQDIESFLNSIKDENILLLDEIFLEKIMGYISTRDKENNIKLFKNIQLIMRAKYENGLKIDLTDNQKSYLNRIEDKLLNFKIKIEKKLSNYTQVFDNERFDELEILIIEFEYLIEKITGNKKVLLDEKDFRLLYENIIEDDTKDYEFKRNILTEFKKYNSNLDNKKLVSIEKVIECFEKYNLNELINIAKNNEELVITKVNIDSIIEILELFKEKKWLDKMEPNTLFTILLFGDIEFIKERAIKVENDVKYKSLFFKTASFWINNIQKRRGKRGKNKNGASKRINPYITAAHEITYEEFLENEKFLSELGFNVSSNSETNMKTLKTPSHKIRENLDYYRLYKILDEDNIKDFPASALAFSSVDDKCDMFIELGLMHGKSNYLRNSPTAINSFVNDVILILYKLKKDTTEDMYYNMIMSETREDKIKTFVYKDKMGYDLKTKEARDEFFKENFFDFVEHIPDSNQYEEVILNNISIDIDEELFANKYIDNLESNYKVNEYIYKFGNQIISRYKVLRNLTALKKADIEINKESLLYSVLRNSYIDEDTFDLIANNIGYSIGVMHKWNI